MKGRQIILDRPGGHEAAALMVDGRVEDLLIDEGTRPRPGTFYRARATRPVKGQGGMFLETPDGTVFFRGARGLAPGDMLTVQVSGYAEPGKAPPVTARLLFKSRYAIVTPEAPGLNLSRQIADDARDGLLELAHEAMDGSEFGLILRSAAAIAPPGEIADDIRAMRDLAQRVCGGQPPAPALLHEGDGPHLAAWREWTDPAEIETAPGGFERLGILDALAALGPDTPLPGGGFISVEPTRALVAVDVNTGPDTSPAAAMKANRAAVAALPRALRLRGLGGQITIDFAPLAKKDRRAIEDQVKKALRADPVDTTLVGWTPLGHLELTRKRERVPLAAIIREITQ